MKIPVRCQIEMSGMEDELSRTLGIPVISAIESEPCEKKDIPWLLPEIVEDPHWEVIRSFEVHGVPIVALCCLNDDEQTDMVLYLKDVAFQVWPNDPTEAVDPEGDKDGCARFMMLQLAMRIPSYERFHARLKKLAGWEDNRERTA